MCWSCPVSNAIEVMKCWISIGSRWNWEACIVDWNLIPCKSLTGGSKTKKAMATGIAYQSFVTIASGKSSIPNKLSKLPTVVVLFLLLFRDPLSSYFSSL